MTWGDDLAAWWLDEVDGDVAYETEVMPLTLDLVAPRPGELWIDLGCGEGRVMRAITAAGAVAVGCDLSAPLAAASGGAVAIARLPELDWIRPGSLDGALAVLVLEHLPDEVSFLEAAARSVRRGGALVVVINHPVFTSPGSAPVIDPEDGEVLWRWGRYLDTGVTHEPAGTRTLAFHHRPLGRLLGAAAAAGWDLERLIEAPVGRQRVADDPLLAGQGDIPRLLGVRWRRR